MCTSNRDARKLENTVKYCQAKPIQKLRRASPGVNWSWSQCIKSHHAQTSSGKGLPSHFWNRNILPGLRRKITGLLLSGPKSSFQMKVNFAFHLEIKVPEFGGRVEGHRIHVAWSPLGCHVICWCWSSVFSEVYSQCSHLPGNFRALHASFCWPKAGSMTMVLLCLINQQTRLTWTRISGVLSRGRWETPDPTIQMTWRPLSKQPGLSLHLRIATGWLPPCHAALMQ